jgi:hypothetical protein
MHAILIAGAALVGLPILLHLIMKQEPKRLTFPAFRFLKQKLKTNQRKLRLRHFILLALRMLIIALFCLTLYQPTFKSDRLNIRGEQPIAVVLVIDTTPSMGYVSNDKTRLKEATQRANELLSELPEKSPIAIVDTADLTGHWLPDVAAARRRLEELKDPKGGQPVTSGVAVAYQLLSKVDQETESPEPLPKLVVVFTDRTVASWDAGRTEDLKKLRDGFPDPKPVHVVIDFGVDAPSNVGILSADMKPQVIAANQVANITVSVGASGGDGTTVSATVLAKPLWSAKAENFTASRDVSIPAGQTRTAMFEFRDLKPGIHQVEFSLKTPDKLDFDNKRYVTFKVGETRRILTITDDIKAAAYWLAAHSARANPEFAVIAVTPEEVQLGDDKTVVVRYPIDREKPDGEKATDDIRSFEAVCLLNVDDPQKTRAADGTLWDRLRPYLQAGGKLIVMPGPDTSTNVESYNVARDLMPGTLKKPILFTKEMNPPPPKQSASSWPEPRDGANGVTWALDETALKHPMLKIIEEWRQQRANLDITANPRLTRKYWNVEPDKAASVVVNYFDAEKPADRHPAILERPVLDPKDGNKPKGKVVLLTTRMDGDDPEEKNRWNDYWEQEGTTWFATFPYMLVRYLAGDTADANFNFTTGATVSVPLPRSKIGRDAKVIFNGPNITGNEALITPTEKQSEIRVGPPKTNFAGNFALSVEKDRAEIWKDGFSVNVPPEESNLEKVPIEAIEEVMDKGRVFSIERNSTLRDWLDIALGQPVDLFPWLLIAVLVLFVAEGLAANRFYRRPKV